MGKKFFVFGIFLIVVLFLFGCTQIGAKIVVSKNSDLQCKSLSAYSNSIDRGDYFYACLDDSKLWLTGSQVVANKEGVYLHKCNYTGQVGDDGVAVYLYESVGATSLCGVQAQKNSYDYLVGRDIPLVLSPDYVQRIADCGKLDLIDRASSKYNPNAFVDGSLDGC